MILSSLRAETGEFEHFDYNHVRDKSPKAGNIIVKRLGVENLD